MLTTDYILTTLRSAKPILEEKYGVKAMALFGSYSRNDATNDSDVDVIVDVDGSIGIRFVDLADELEMLLHHKVDLVALKGIKPRYFNIIKPDLIYV